MEEEPPCTLTISPTGGSLPAAGGSGTITITASSPDCDSAWTAAAQDGWLSVDPAGGSGGGTVTYTAGANTGPERTGRITVAGKTVTVTQAGTAASIAGNWNLSMRCRAGEDQGEVRSQISISDSGGRFSGNGSGVGVNGAEGTFSVSIQGSYVNDYRGISATCTLTDQYDGQFWKFSIDKTLPIDTGYFNSGFLSGSANADPIDCDTVPEARFVRID
jgi:hypothetical protein